MSAPNPLAVPPDPQAGSRADTPVMTTDSPARLREGKASCGFCGQAWFGAVAYCPYCGHPSTEVAADRGAVALLAADRAHAGGPARTEVPEGAGDLRAAAGAAGSPAVAQGPDRVAAASAAARGAMQVITASIQVHAGRLRPSRAPAGLRAEAPGNGRAAGWKPTIAVIATLAVIAVTVDRLTNAVHRPTPDAVPAAVAPHPGPTRDASASSTQAPPPTQPLAPRADRDAQPRPQAPMPPAPQRPLCSAANEAAGLCNPR